MAFSSKPWSYAHTLPSRLEPFAPALRTRFAAFQKQLNFIDQNEGGLAKFAEGYKSMGFQVDKNGGVHYREWAPNAIEARLIGDFSTLMLWGLKSSHAPRQLVSHRQSHDQK